MRTNLFLCTENPATKLLQLHYNPSPKETEDIFLGIHKISEAVSAHGKELGSLHVNNFYTLLWLQAGSATVHTITDETHIKPETLMIMPPNLLHCLKVSDGTEGVSIVVSQSIFRRRLSVYRGAWGQDSVRLDMEKMKPYTAATINDTLRLMHKGVAGAGTLADVIASSALLDFLFTLFLRSTRHNRHKEHGTAAADASLLDYQQFLKLLDENYHAQQSTAFYAGEIGIPRKALALATKAYSGKTPAEIINEKLIFEAKIYLTETNMRIKEIAKRLGFKDDTYFTHFFRKHTKLPPAQYRELYWERITAAEQNAT